MLSPGEQLALRGASTGRHVAEIAACAGISALGGADAALTGPCAGVAQDGKLIWRAR